MLITPTRKKKLTDLYLSQTSEFKDQGRKKSQSFRLTPVHRKAKDPHIVVCLNPGTPACTFQISRLDFLVLNEGIGRVYSVVEKCLIIIILILSFQQKTHPISYLCCYKNTCRQCSLHQVGAHQSGHLCPRDVFQASLRRLSVGLHSSVFTQATQQNGKPGPPHLIQNHYSDPNDLISLYSAVGNQEE